MKRLAELAEFVMGQAPPGRECNKDGRGTPFVKAGEFATDSPIVREWTTKPLKTAGEGDVLVCVVGATAGKVNLGIDCAIGRSVAAVRPNADILETRFLYRFLQSKVMQLRAKSQGMAQGVITREMLGSLALSLPPLPEQKRIAAILDAADALRGKRRESIKQLDALIQSTFIDMFGDPVTNPMGWEKKSLGELIKVKSGNGLTAKDMAGDGTFAVYGGNGISGRHDQYMFDEPKIVIGRVGVYCGSVHVTQPKSWITDNALYVSELYAPIEIDYLVQAIVNADLNQYAGRAAQPLISGSRIYPVEIPVPPLEEQAKFSRFLAGIRLQEFVLKRHAHELDGLFTSLQSRAFTSEL